MRVSERTFFTARFAKDAEKDRVLKANKHDAVLCVLCAFARVNSSLIRTLKLSGAACPRPLKRLVQVSRFAADKIFR